MKVVYEIFDSFQLLSLISIVRAEYLLTYFDFYRGVASPCGGVAVGDGLYALRTRSSAIACRLHKSRPLQKWYIPHKVVYVPVLINSGSLFDSLRTRIPGKYNP